jgi:small subunit ribosomal protein S9
MWDALVGKRAKGDYYDPCTWEVFLQTGRAMNQAVVDRLDVLGLAAVEAELQGLRVEDETSERWVGWGRYKSAIACAVLRPGSGEFRVNGQPVWEYFGQAPGRAQHFLRRLLESEMAKQVLAEVAVVVEVEGSSPTTMRQAKAVTHAVARALTDYDSRQKGLLRRAGFGGVKVKDSNIPS